MKYIAYSIFGFDRRYFDGLLRCIEDASRFYENWKVIVYADRLLDPDWLGQLSALPVVLELREENSRWAGLYWRFEVFDRADCEFAIIRDADSMLSQREARFVREWEQSGADLHIIRDHPDHEWPINAGMWGARNVFDFTMRDLIDRWCWKEAKFGDQHFLRCQIYKKHHPAVFVHSSSIAYKGEPVRWVDTVDDFIGRVYFAKAEPSSEGVRRVLPQPSSFREFRWLLEMMWRKFEAFCLFGARKN